MHLEKELKELIEIQFCKDNFKIVTSNNSAWNYPKYAVVYCSSNGVFREDTAECFRKSIIEKDNFEWYMNRFSYAEKHIFIRDVSKRFYQFGINNKELNSIEKIAEKIKKETQDYKIITIGSSSGGTAAIILGKLLNADFAMVFSPILKSSPNKTDLNNNVKKNEEYIDKIEYAKSNIPVFWAFPSESECDIYNAAFVSEFDNIHFLPIISNVHGVPLNKRILKKLLSLDKEELIKIFKYKSTEKVSEYRFTLENWGFKMYLLRIFDFIKKYPLFFLRKDFYKIVIK